LHDEQHVQVRREILQRVPFLLTFERVVQFTAAGKMRIDHRDLRHLLRTVIDEFASEHQQVGIGRCAMEFVAIAAVLRIAAARLAGVERIAARVDRDETVPARDPVELRVATDTRVVRGEVPRRAREVL